MEHRISHGLSPELAREAARRAADSYAERFARYSPRVDWSSEDEAAVSFSAKGMTLRGGLRLEPGAIVVHLDVPRLLRPLAGRALGIIEEEVRRWVERVREGEP